MGYVVNGSELETDEQGFLVEADYGDEVVKLVAARCTEVESGARAASEVASDLGA